MARKQTNINIVDTAVGLLIANEVLMPGGGVHSVLGDLQKGDYLEGVRDLGVNVLNPKVINNSIKYVAGGVAFKWLAKGLRTRKIAGVGGVNLNV